MSSDVDSDKEHLNGDVSVHVNLLWEKKKSLYKTSRVRKDLKGKCKERLHFWHFSRNMLCEVDIATRL